MMQEENHIFQGMRRDNHEIKQDSKFLWDAHNIRLTNRDDNTLFSITNERGTSNPLLTLQGSYVGHCTVGDFLIVFTAKEDKSNNYIYRIEKTDEGFKTIILFHEPEVWDKGWSPEHPIEALGYYETSLVQKVYWVDGVNQPRVINVAKPELKLPNECILDGVNFSRTYKKDNVNCYYLEDREVDKKIEKILESNPGKTLYNTNSFDFVKELQLQDIINVEKIYGEGEFTPGTIQYAISYFNKYEQESNISCVTPLYYASPKDRGGSPEEKVSCSFRLDIDFPDKNFEYIRLYSIHRTSIDAIPTVKIVEDIPINGDTVTYIDTGTKGDAIDPNQLLYVGGESIIANCITDKDRTLFLGNISLLNNSLTNIKKLITNNTWEDFTLNPVSTYNDSVCTYYDYTPNLSEKYSGIFKYGEKYRCGVQVQFKDGRWSEPIFVGYKQLCDKPIWETPINSKCVTLENTEDPDDPNKPSIQQTLLSMGVKRLRACITPPRIENRRILCQGILCPTVFGVSGRRINSPYAISSWFFRPASGYNDNSVNVYNGASIQFKHNFSLFAGEDRGAEIQNMLGGANTIGDITDSIGDYASHYFVDENVVTFHSPDIEFDSSLANLDFTDIKLNIIGVARLGAISGDIDVQTSTPSIGEDSGGFLHNKIGYTTCNNNNINGGLVSSLSYVDKAINIKNDFSVESNNMYYLIYPWHKSGSLNNDVKRPESDNKKTQSAILQKKIISNLKFFNVNKSIQTHYGTNNLQYFISTPKIFSSNELSIEKVEIPYINTNVPYMGNIDTLVTGSEKYPTYVGIGYNSQSISPVKVEEETLLYNEPVRIKYKSSPHIVFSLKNNIFENINDSIQLLPRYSLLEESILNGDTYSVPKWQDKITSTSNPSTPDDNNIIRGNLVWYSSKNLPNATSFNDVVVGSYAVGLYNGKIVLVQLIQNLNGVNSWVISSGNGSFKQTYELTIEKDHTYTDRGEAIPGTKDEDYQDHTSAIGSTWQYKGDETYITIHTDNFGEVILTETPSKPSHVKPAAPGKDNIYTLAQDEFTIPEEENNISPYLLIGELVRDRDKIPDEFGISEESLKRDLWIPAGRTYPLTEGGNISKGNIIVPFEYGDTWYSRYDCLKTYPFTKEDENQVVEIGSFMLETRVNIDGRYDRNRGQISNLNMSPQNFNLINDVYSQKDNFFNYRILDEDYYKQSSFVNQVTWSQEKHAGEDIDTWTHITLANTLDMDGSKGKVTALKSWNEYLMCFQEKALNQILFNSRTQIPVSDGVPIEISNGYKVDGSRLFTGTIGCNNKWSIINTTTGIYFADSNTNNLYLFNGQLTNLSQDRGMNWWTRENNVNTLWKPIPYVNNGLRTFYDSKYGDVYFTPGPKLGITLNPNDALCYSEQLGQFTSLMSYGDTQAMFNFADGFYSLRESDGNLKLYQNNVGEYNNFFGEYKGWDFSFISNDKPLVTKIFDTVELRADHYNTYQIKSLLYDCPVSFIKAQNEYQNGEANTPSGKAKIRNKNMMNKFRIWRGIIPRHNGTMQRIRNPWAMITLGWKPKSINDIAKKLPLDATREKIDAEYHKYNTKEVMVHDVSVKYTI